MMKRMIMAWFVLAVAVGVAGEPDTSVPPKAVVTKVDVTEPHPVIVISDAAQFAKLLSFFPDLSKEKETDLAGGWEGKTQIVFQFRGRPEVKVTTSSDDTLWTSGKGDKPLKNGLSALLDPMFKKK